MGWQVMNPFSFLYTLFSGGNCICSLCFYFITDWFSLDTSSKTTFWMISDCSTVCWDWFVYRWYVSLYSKVDTSSLTNRMYIFWRYIFFTVFILISNSDQSISSLEQFFFSFRQTFYWKSLFLSLSTLETSVIF